MNATRLRGADGLAGIAIVLCVLLAYSVRHTVNPDGVSYLDLSAVLANGDWQHFVQGYWSPLFPAMISLISVLTGVSGRNLVSPTHYLNAAAVIAAIGILWHWSRHAPNKFFGRLAFATLLLCSDGLPRLEALTPDVLLLGVVAWLGYELLPRQGARWIRVGILFGLSFLIKTSNWPWLLIGMMVRFGFARGAQERRAVTGSSLIAAGIALLWIVPLSMKEGHPTVGSAARLNYCWYLEHCDSQTPDTHNGAHSKYSDVSLAGGTPVRVAHFDESTQWTYQPWSDPTDWASGVTSRNSTPVTLNGLVSYWSGLIGFVFGVWLLPLFLAVLIPAGFIAWRSAPRTRDAASFRNGLVVAILGLLGLAQFIAVHAETRLIASFGFLLGLGVLHMLCSNENTGEVSVAEPPASLFRRCAGQFAATIGIVCAIIMGIGRLRTTFEASTRIEAGAAQVARVEASLAAHGISQKRLVVIGPVMPVLAQAFWMGGKIVAQVPPRSVPAIASLPPEQLALFLREHFGGIADIAWLTRADAQVQMVPIPPK